MCCDRVRQLHPRRAASAIIIPMPSRARTRQRHAPPVIPVAQFGPSVRDVVRCRVCGRTLLLGERSTGCFTHAGDGPFDVCQLCVPTAGRYGLRPRPSTPDEVAREQQRGRARIVVRAVRRLVPRLGGAGAASSVMPPLGAAAIPVALAAFNASEHARMLSGLSRTLGKPRASVVPRSPLDREVILTVAWEIVWYQFRIQPDGTIRVERGTYLTELPVRWQQWNCAVRASGHVTSPTADRNATADALLAPTEVAAEMSGAAP